MGICVGVGIMTSDVCVNPQVTTCPTAASPTVTTLTSLLFPLLPPPVLDLQGVAQSRSNPRAQVSLTCLYYGLDQEAKMTLSN